MDHHVNDANALRKYSRLPPNIMLSVAHIPSENKYTGIIIYISNHMVWCGNTGLLVCSDVV